MPNVIASGKGIGSTAGVRTDSITVPSGTTKLLVFPCWAENSGRIITSVAFGAASLSEVDSTTGDFLRVGAWELDNPTPSTANLVTTCNQSTISVSHHWVCLDASGAVTATAKAEGNTVVVSSASGALVVGIGVRRDATAVTVGADQTLLESDFTAPLTRSAVSSEPGASSVTHSYSWADGDTETTLALSVAASAPSGPSSAATTTHLLNN